MNAIAAIALQTLRGTIRSRVVLALSLLLGLTQTGLPSALHTGDTLASILSIQINYSLGLAQWMLSLIALWAGCAAISQEIRDRPLQMVAVKPVSRLSILLGKWAGLNLVLGLLILLSGFFTYAGIQLARSAHRDRPEEITYANHHILTARKLVEPDLTAPAAALKASLLSNPSAPTNLTAGELRTMAWHQALTVQPGTTHHFLYPLPSVVQKTTPATLEYVFTSAFIADEPARLQWTVLDHRGNTLHTEEATVSQDLQHALTFDLPPGVSAIRIQCAVLSRQTVAFDPARRFSLLLGEKSFEANLLRYLLQAWFDLALLAAIGVTAGSILSLPVAALSSLYALLLLRLGTFFQESFEFTAQPHSEGQASLWIMISDWTSRTVEATMRLTAPLQTGEPLNWLTGGQALEWTWLLQMGLMKMIVYPAVLMAGGVFIFNRRELALPAND